MVMVPQGGTKTRAEQVILTCSKHRPRFVSWAQHIVYVEFATLFLQCKVSGLQNISGCCQLKFGFCNAFGQGLYTQGRCFWNSQHMHGAPPRWISSSGNLVLVHLSGANFFLLLFYFFLTSEGLVLNFFRRSNSCPAKTLTISEQMSVMVTIVVMPNICSYQDAVLNTVSQ